MESGLFQRADQERGRLRPRPALQRLDGAAINVSPWHGRQYIRYTGGWIDRASVLGFTGFRVLGFRGFRVLGVLAFYDLRF